jgi:hypothetical protein
MPGGRMGTPPLRGALPEDGSPRRTSAAEAELARHRAIAARRVIRTCPDEADRVALLDMLGLLPSGWPRDSRGRPYLPVISVSDWVARVDRNGWFHGTLAPCSGPTFRVKVAQHGDENAGGECPPD